MSDIICVTDRHQCAGDFLAQVEAIAAGGAAAIILREKDLPPEDYFLLARDVLARCTRYATPCILHSHAEVALRLNCPRLHLPLPALEALPESTRRRFPVLGASCHSPDDARRAAALGCTYLTAGHIFATTCKPGLPPRGLSLLREIVSAVDLPVYAIGGIAPENVAEVRDAGAAGACVMGALMRAHDAAQLLRRFAPRTRPPAG